MVTTWRKGNQGCQAPPVDLTPAGVADYRQRLSRGENVIDPERWAGSLPAAQGIAPRVRVGRDKWFNLLWLLPIGWVGLIVAVAVAKGLWATHPSRGSSPATRRRRSRRARIRGCPGGWTPSTS